MKASYLLGPVAVIPVILINLEEVCFNRYLSSLRYIDKINIKYYAGYLNQYIARPGARNNMPGLKFSSRPVSGFLLLLLSWN